jgi:signal recognition particle GTPase
MTQKSTLEYLRDIFNPIVRSKINEDHDYVLIFESEFGSYLLQSIEDFFQAIDLATKKIKLDDGWEAVYVVEISSGRSWPIEYIARLGDEISL